MPYPMIPSSAWMVTLCYSLVILLNLTGHLSSALVLDVPPVQVSCVEHPCHRHQHLLQLGCASSGAVVDWRLERLHLQAQRLKQEIRTGQLRVRIMIVPPWENRRHVRSMIPFPPSAVRPWHRRSFWRARSLDMNLVIQACSRVCLKRPTVK